MIIELERKKSYYFFLLSFFIISLAFISLVAAVPPLTTEFVGDTGLAIEANVQDYYQINEGACIHIYVFNRSNGEQLSNPTVSCEVELTDENGTVVLQGYPTTHEGHFKMCRPATIVTKLETYGLTIVCNSSMVGGYKTHFFVATETGKGPGALAFFVFVFVISYGIGFIGFFGKNEWISILGGFACLSLGIYTVVNGIDIYRNFITLGISYFTIAMGAIFTLIPALEMINENFGRWLNARKRRTKR